MSNLIASFEQHYEELLRYLVRRTGNADRAADIAQDTYVRLVSMETGAPEVANPRAYVFRVAGNLAIDTARKESRIDSRTSPESWGLGVADPLASPERTCLARERLTQLDNALSDLPPNARRAILMSRVDGATFAEIARRLGVSESMVAKYIAQALRACRQRLDSLDQDR